MQTMQTMQELIDTIRLAVADGATSEAKQAGAHACQMILAALGAEAGKPLVSPAAPAAPPPAGLKPGQMLDLVIAKLRSVLPPEDAGGRPAAEPPAFRVELAAIPTAARVAGKERQP